MTSKTYTLDSDTMRDVINCADHRGSLLANRMYSAMIGLYPTIKRRAYTDDVWRWQDWFDGVRNDLGNTLTVAETSELDYMESVVKACDAELSRNDDLVKRLTNLL